MLGNTSSTCVEALALGIPVIVIGSQSGLTQNPIPENVSHDFWRLCYTPEELLGGIEYFVGNKENISTSFRSNRGAIKKEFFEPIATEGVKKFLSIPI